MGYQKSAVIQLISRDWVLTMLPPSTVKPVLFISPADAVGRGAADKQHTLLELLHKVVHNLLQFALIYSECLLEVLNRSQKVLRHLVHGPCTA